MQPQNFAYIRLLNKPYENESPWKGKFDPLKAASILKFGTFLNGTRSLDAENLGSVGQWASKILAVKFEVFKKMQTLNFQQLEF